MTQNNHRDIITFKNSPNNINHYTVHLKNCKPIQTPTPHDRGSNEASIQNVKNTPFKRQYDGLHQMKVGKH